MTFRLSNSHIAQKDFMGGKTFEAGIESLSVLATKNRKQPRPQDAEAGAQVGPDGPNARRRLPAQQGRGRSLNACGEGSAASATRRSPPGDMKDARAG